MHEVAVCEDVLAVTLDAARGEPVARVRVRVGARREVAPDSFRFCWTLVAQGTAAEEAVIELHHVDGDIVEVEEVELRGGEVRPGSGPLANGR
jgi:hydrogenase nickel incorporation protein HypA/HybF